jgi:hypothetical protein
MAIFTLAGTEGLRDEGVKTEEKSESEEGDGGENV